MRKIGLIQYFVRILSIEKKMNKNILRISPQSAKKQMKNSDCSQDNKTRRRSTSNRDE